MMSPKVTEFKAAYPLLFKCIDLLIDDNIPGQIREQERPRLQEAMVDALESSGTDTTAAEMELSELNLSDLEDLCCGDDWERLRIIDANDLNESETAIDILFEAL